MKVVTTSWTEGTAISGCSPSARPAPVWAELSAEQLAKMAQNPIDHLRRLVDRAARRRRG